jgi:hypothetical protein
MSYQKLQVTKAKAVVPSDELIDTGSTAPNTGCVLYVGTGGSLDVVTASGDEVTFVNVLSGSFLPVQVLKVLDTSSAEDIIALW